MKRCSTEVEQIKTTMRYDYITIRIVKIIMIISDTTDH